MQTSRVEMKNNVTLTISSASGVLAADEVPAIVFEKTKSERSLRGAINLTGIRQALWDAAEIVQGFVRYCISLVLSLSVLLCYSTLLPDDPTPQPRANKNKLILDLSFHCDGS